MEVFDRYSALGIPLPDPATMCQSQCEGTGWVPVKMEYLATSRGWDASRWAGEDDPRLVGAWFLAHDRCPWLFEPCDGWHFVKCPDCKGTGRR
jgi:hypothetical protein